MSGWAKIAATVLALLTLIACSNGDDAEFISPTPILQEIIISPQDVELPVGVEAQYTATGHWPL